MEIYHNPRCSKSRETLAIINESGQEIEIIEYMKNNLTKKELLQLLSKLNLKPEQLVRKQEPVFKQEYKGLQFSDEEWVQVMLENPKLIERPIVVKGNKAVLGRPPENVRELL